jgi:hypothetical protein
MMPETARFRERLQRWPEKTFFSGHQATDVYFGLTIVRFLAKWPVSNTA